MAGKEIGTFKSIEDVINRFKRFNYICNRKIATAIFLADHIESPLLVKSPAGAGKTELVKVFTSAHGLELIRLQCF